MWGFITKMFGKILPSFSSDDNEVIVPLTESQEFDVYIKGIDESTNQFKVQLDVQNANNVKQQQDLDKELEALTKEGDKVAS